MGFFYLSQALGRPVTTERGDRVARIKDLVARIELVEGDAVASEPYAPITGLEVELHKRAVFIPWAQIAALSAEGARLASSRVDLQSFERREGEVLLRRDILDKQLVDVDGRRVILASDLLLYEADGTVLVAAVDVSAEALLRRLAFGRLFTGTEGARPPAPPGRTRRRRRPGAPNLIPWPEVEPLYSGTRGARLRLPHDRLSRLHPVDLAQILGDLNYHYATEIIESLDDEMAADTLQEINEERQADIVEGMDEARAAEILEEMAPDDAADLLADLAEDQARELLRRMDRDDAEDVEQLLRYPENSAGGIMTSAFLSLPARLTVDETVAFMRQLEDAPDLIDYLYIVEEKDPATDWAQVARQGGGTLLGIVSLRALLLSPGDQTLQALMTDDFVWVNLEDPCDKAARLISRYNLMALPVLDENERIHGVITVDDVMEVVLPERQLRRLPRVFG